MRNYHPFFVGLFTYCLLCCATTVLALKPTVEYAVFSIPNKGAYIETYLLIPGSTVTFVPTDDGQFQAQVEVTLLFKQGEKIAKFDKYLLKSPIAKSPDSVNFNLIDLKRNVLKDGEYELDISFKDVNQPEKTAQYNEKLTIKQEKEALSLSDILLIESYEEAQTASEYTKSGYNLVPNVLNFYPDNNSRLAFYAEVYNSDKVLDDPNFLIMYAIHHQQSGKIANNLRGFKKQKAQVVNPILAELDISKLPSGNYDLVLEVRSKKNELLLTHKHFFQRSKKRESVALSDLGKVKTENTFVENLQDETIKTYVRALAPIATNSEKQYINNLVASKKVDFMRQFLYNFWVGRAPYAPEREFAKYQKALAYVDKEFKSQIYEGYESDRGRVYLQYGVPNNRDRSPNEPGMVPFEVWHYYNVSNKQGGAKFVFYNPQQADNEYELIHSDARGEISEPRWKLKVSKAFQERSNSMDFDATGVRRHYGSHIDDF